MSKFGQRLRGLLEETDIEGKDFAEVMHVEPPTVSNWLNGKRFPRDEMLIQIADYFKVSLDYLLGRTDNKNGLIVNDNIDGSDIQIEVDNEIYPEGLTHEEVLEVLKKLKEFGVDWEKFKRK
jgi:transcriptional regulator with XRE-family HTH domain